jgi:multiple sugar transport system permease protein
VEIGLSKAGKYFLLLLISGVLITPLALIILTSLKEQAQIYSNTASLFPNPLTFKNFITAFEAIEFLKAFKNTFYIAFFNIFGVVIASSLAAYAFSVLEWKGRDIFFSITLGTMMVPEMTLLIPQFLLFKETGLYGGFLPLIIPYFFGLPYYIFLFRQFFLSIPKTLRDSAKIDGASEFTIWLDIYMALSKPIIMIVILFQFLISWNDLLKPSIFLISEKNYTLSLALQQYLSRLGGAEWGPLMAGAIIMVLPILIIFFFSQKTLIKGITISGLKD